MHHPGPVRDFEGRPRAALFRARRAGGLQTAVALGTAFRQFAARRNSTGALRPVIAALDRTLSDRRNARLRAQSEARFRSAPLRAIKDPADAAGVLMRLVALARGTPTPEQEAAIEAEMGKITPPGEDLSVRLAYIRHAAAQAESADVALDHLAPCCARSSTPPSATISNG